MKSGNDQVYIPLDSTEPQDPVIEPKFNYRSGNFNLEYKRFWPFIGVYLFYKYIWSQK